MSPPHPDHRHRPEWLAVLLSVALAILVCFVSNNLSARFQHRAETIDQQFAILSGGPLLFDGHEYRLGEWRSRVLFPLVLRAASSATQAVSVGQWYLALTLLSAIGAFASFWFLVRSTVGGDVRLAAAGLFLLAYQVMFTFNQGWEHTTDFPDVAFAALFVWAVLTRRRWWLLGIVLLATLNRESSVFAGLIWLFVYGLRRYGPRRGLAVRSAEVAFAVGLSVVAYVEAVVVRSIVPRPASAATTAAQVGTSIAPDNAAQLGNFLGWWDRAALDVMEVVHHPSFTSWPFLWLAMLMPAIAWIWLNRCYVQDVQQRLLLATACIFPISLAFGTPSELREYLTPLVVLAYVAVALEGERARRAALRADFVYQPAVEQARDHAHTA